MILVQLISGDYWEIVSLFYSNPEQYTPKVNQKIIMEHDWQLKSDTSAYNKDEVVWDDKDKQVILYPEHLKVAKYKQQALDEIASSFVTGSSDIAVGEQTLSNIISDIKSADTLQKVDAAKAKLKDEKDKFLKRIGL